MSVYHRITPPQMIGVLHGRTLYRVGGNIALDALPVDLTALDEIAARYRLMQLWLHPDTPLIEGVTQHWFITDTARHIVAPKLDYHFARDEGWKRAANGQTLLDAILLLNDVLGSTYLFSPGSTGTRLADELAPRSRQPVVGDWPAPALNPNLVRDGFMVRPLTPDETQRRWVHSYDKNGMYLAACSSTELGIACLARWEQPDLNGVPFNTHLPGYWHTAAGWLVTPSMQLMGEELGRPPLCWEAYVWTEHTRALRPWYARLRDARTTLMAYGPADPPHDAALIALQVLKRIYTISLGWWASERFNERDSPRFRPDWRHAVMATAAANMRRTIARLNAAGTPPIAWTDVDTLHFVSDEEDPQRAAPPQLKMGAALGHFKHKRTRPLGEAVAVLDDLRRRVEARRHGHDTR